jgi:hypothetical protein
MECVITDFAVLHTWAPPFHSAEISSAWLQYQRGDQIGRIFVYWATLFFWEFFEN